MKEVSTVVAPGKFIVIGCLAPGDESLAWSLITRWLAAWTHCLHLEVPYCLYMNFLYPFHQLVFVVEDQMYNSCTFMWFHGLILEADEKI